MTTPAPRRMLIAGTIYGAAMLAALIAWGLWKNAQAAAGCGSDCGRALTLMLALGVVLAPGAALLGALVERAATRTSRVLAHAVGGVVVVGAVAVLRHSLSSALT